MTKEVFILGAGFSKAIYHYMPLLNDLTNSVTRKLKIDYDPIIDLGKARDSFPDKKLIEHFANIPDQIKNNLESLLCYLIQDYPWKDDIQRHFDQALYLYLIDTISKQFKSLVVTVGSQETFNPKELFRYIHSRSIPIISFNYDMVFERLYTEHCRKKYIEYEKKEKNLSHKYIIRIYDEYSIVEDRVKQEIEKKGYWIDDRIYASNKSFIHVMDPKKVLNNHDFGLNHLDIKKIEAETFKRPNLKYLYKIPMTAVNERINGKVDGSEFEYEIAHLLKLHGSANWYYNDKELFYEDFAIGNGYEIPTLEFEEGKGRVTLDYGNFYKAARHGLKPLIIPPVLDKNNFYSNDILKGLWGMAADYVKNAKTINLIGYSIPETDLAIKYFLQANINPDAEINIVNLCQYKDEEILEDFKNLFKEKLVGFNNVNTDYIHYDEDLVLKKFINDRIISKKDSDILSLIK